MVAEGKRVRLGAVVLVASALVLTSCGGDDEAGPGPTGPTADSGCGYAAGPFSNAVTVTGDFGGKVTAKFATPFKPTGLERTVVTAGTGKETTDGSAVNATVNVFNGRTGALISSQTGKTTVGDPGPKMLAAGLQCVPIGSRVVATAPASELFGETGNSQVGLAASDGVVIVTDVAEVVKPPETGAWPDAPAITFRGRKSPLVGDLTGTPPSTVLVDVITPGTGQKVQAGDQITVNFKSVIWGSGKVVAETYGDGKAPVTYGTNDFLPGFTAAVVGQRAGAQLVVAVPPEFGYGKGGNEAAGISGTDTLLFVIEIQTTKPQAQP